MVRSYFFAFLVLVALVAAAMRPSAVVAYDFVTPTCNFPGGCLQFSPSVPTSNDQVGVLAVVRSGWPSGACVTSLTTRVVAQTVYIDSTYGTIPGLICFPFNLIPEISTTLPPLSPGTYAVRFTAQPDSGYPSLGWVLGPNGWIQAAVHITASLDVGAPPSAHDNYQGLWWNTSEPGWGLNVAHQGDQIYVTWYTYDSAGRPAWLSTLASKGPSGVFGGDIVRFRGPSFESSPFAPMPLGSVVGTAMIAFTDASSGSFSYTVDNVAQTKTITRYRFGPEPICTYAAAPDFADATNYQDLWWDSAEPGWGINLTHQGSQIYATWYTYDIDGSPMWLVSLMAPSAPSTYTGSLLRFTGPAFYTLPFGPPPTATTVGGASLMFASGNAATWSYTVGTISGNKSISRFLFAAPAGTLCH